MRVDDRGHLAGQRTVTTFQSSTDIAADYDDLLLRRRSQRRNRAAALAVSAVVAVLAVISVQANLAAGPKPQPMQPEPTPDVGGVAVWYDEEGLHRGEAVEQTAIDLVLPGRGREDPLVGALALVRTGAVYSDPATHDVWFHPWDGDPRMVGRNSRAGPGGDLEGDTAAWFEGSELVVYDTAAGREISRAGMSTKAATCQPFCMEHIRGNGFLQVSAERIVWKRGPGGGGNAYSHDVLTGTTSVGEAPVIDVHNDASVVGDYSRNNWALILSTPGRAEERYPDLEPRARLSPNGDYVLAVEDAHGATIIDTGTGDLWRVGGNKYPWIAWSYGDIALVDTEDALLACDAGRRTCKPLPVEGEFLMPTN